MARRTTEQASKEIELLVQSRHGCLYIVTWEEQRLTDILAEICKTQKKTAYHWSVTTGLNKLADALRDRVVDDGTRDPMTALEAISQFGEPSVFILKDLHAFFTEPKIVRAVRELAMQMHGTFRTLIIVSPVLQIPPELEKDMTVLDFPLPDHREIQDLFIRVTRAAQKTRNLKVDLSKVQAHQMIEAALGLTLTEAENAFDRAVHTDNTLDRSDIDLVLQEKKQIIRKSQILDYYSAEESLGNIGGIDLLKAWLSERGRAFSIEARDYGIPEPKGLLLMGVQGCGKSLTAKAISSLWRMPLLRFDVGTAFSSLMGSSEANVRKAIATAEAVAPCILWIDEIEKGLSGTANAGASDAGTMARVFNTFLTWLQEKRTAVFVVATANQIEQLPPELLRKGRFDEIFFLDLPSTQERREILQIHLAKRKRDVTQFDLEKVAQISNQFSGAELEQLVISALYRAFHQTREVTTDDLCAAAKESIPLAVTMEEDIQQLRRWASTRARMASSVG